MSNEKIHGWTTKIDYHEDKHPQIWYNYERKTIKQRLGNIRSCTACHYCHPNLPAEEITKKIHYYLTSNINIHK